jgi:ABC-2 type transport system ATP-binding protein
MIVVEDIVKRYGATVAVNHVSFKVDRGEILGFLGPNGAGKSTTLKILTCYIVADSGTVTVDGHDVLEDSLGVRQAIGYLPENTPIYPEMRVLDFLRFVGRTRRLPAPQLREAIDRVVQQVDIERMLKKNVGYLSKGYRQRVGLAQALLHDPQILILDEPTSGLDPHQIIEIRELLRQLGRTKSIVFSSHILQEISAVCTRIIVINDGRLVADGKPEELQKRATGREVFRATIQGPPSSVRERLGAAGEIDSVEILSERPSGGEFRIRARDGADLGLAVYRIVKDNGWALSALVPEWRTLEEVYLQLTARGREKTGKAG